MDDRLHFADLLRHMQESKRWTAPYGVIEGRGTSKKGRKYKSIVFGVARFLDAEIQYFSPTFITVRGQGALADRIEGNYISIRDVITILDDV